MKKTLALALAAAALVAVPASAAVLVDHGITYELTETSVTNGGLTANFILAISGINSATDTEGGRTGINAFAFNDAPDAVSGSSAGYVFALGGLNSSGCDGAGEGFFCFDNTSIPPTPTTLLGDSLSIVFSVTSDTLGSWGDNFDPSFKIDWVGTKNNYDLVSKDIPVNGGTCVGSGCPTPTPTGVVPEPATWAMMLLGFGAVGFSMRRTRRRTLAQIA
jgi:hypothetical protein